MERYIEFNAVKFLKDARNWEKEKKELLKQLDSITEIKGIDNSPIRSGRLHDSVADVAAERESIRNQIERIENCQRILEYVQRKLSPEQWEIIDTFFFKSGYVNRNAQKIAKKYAVDYPKGIYRLRGQVIAEISKMLTNKYVK
jgi:hypothetical protein